MTKPQDGDPSTFEIMLGLVRETAARRVTPVFELKVSRDWTTENGIPWWMLEAASCYFSVLPEKFIADAGPYLSTYVKNDIIGMMPASARKVFVTREEKEAFGALVDRTEAEGLMDSVAAHQAECGCHSIAPDKGLPCRRFAPIERPSVRLAKDSAGNEWHVDPQCKVRPEARC